MNTPTVTYIVQDSVRNSGHWIDRTALFCSVEEAIKMLKAIRKYPHAIGTFDYRIIERTERVVEG